MKTGWAWLLMLIAVAQWSRAATGVIIPAGKQTADPAVLSIESMEVRVSIDNGHATVQLEEVFHNKTAQTMEGTYWLALTGDAAVSDFAVWDDLTRIPGVILERKRAGELYEQIRNQAIDPALLESGEVSESNAPGEARHSNEFSVKIVPIPAYGYKRIEAAYRQSVPLNELASELVLPLKSSEAGAAEVGSLSIELDLKSPQTISNFSQPGGAYRLTVGSQSGHEVRASFAGRAVKLTEDLAVRYALANEATPGVVAYRSGAPGESGFFEASAIVQGAPGREAKQPHTVLVLFDSSLSMQWEKLEASFRALEETLRSLRSQDRFNVMVFNSEVTVAYPGGPVPASAEAVAKALDFVKARRLRGGTNLEKAFAAAFAQSGEDTTVVLLSDGEATEGTLGQARLSSWFERSWKALPAARRPHMYVFATGDDANVLLLKRLASHAGVFEQAGSSEPIDFKLSSFVRKIGLTPADRMELAISPGPGAKLVYRSGAGNFAGARAAWVGQYAKPGGAKFTVESSQSGATRQVGATVRLPEHDEEHTYLPAAWGRARVDALLEKIDREGEDKASIDEIIRLSRQYHFVTPYTSFLAAPRALLRPRLIRPGDPLLRVRTDASIVSVIALFPFGLVKPLRYLAGEDIWQTRFVAPADMADGTQTVRLILRDREGHVFREGKTFVISSHPPVLRVRLESARVHAGSRVALRVEASSTTRTITARLYGANPLALRWNEMDRSNSGVLQIPDGLPAGRYSIHVTAEDIAHNVSRQEVPIEVLP